MDILRSATSLQQQVNSFKFQITSDNTSSNSWKSIDSKMFGQISLLGFRSLKSLHQSSKLLTAQLVLCYVLWEPLLRNTDQLTSHPGKQVVSSGTDRALVEHFPSPSFRSRTADVDFPAKTQSIIYNSTAYL